MSFYIYAMGYTSILDGCMVMDKYGLGVEGLLTEWTE